MRGLLKYRSRATDRVIESIDTGCNNLPVSVEGVRMDEETEPEERNQPDQRNYKRKILENCHMTYRVKGDNENRKGVVKNLSDGGLLIMSERQIADGDRLTLIVKPKNSFVAPLEAHVEVIWAESLDSDCYRAGVKILRMLNRDQ